MKDIPELIEVRFVNAVVGVGHGRALSAQLKATADLKLALVGDAVIVTVKGRTACVVPITNVTYVVPAPVVAAVPAGAAAAPAQVVKK